MHRYLFSNNGFPHLGGTQDKMMSSCKTFESRGIFKGDTPTTGSTRCKFKTLLGEAAGHTEEDFRIKMLGNHAQKPLCMNKPAQSFSSASSFPSPPVWWSGGALLDASFKTSGPLKLATTYSGICFQLNKKIAWDLYGNLPPPPPICFLHDC